MYTTVQVRERCNVQYSPGPTYKVSEVRLESSIRGSLLTAGQLTPTSLSPVTLSDSPATLAHTITTHFQLSPSRRHLPLAGPTALSGPEAASGGL